MWLFVSHLLPPRRSAVKDPEVTLSFRVYKNEMYLQEKCDDQRC